MKKAMIMATMNDDEQWWMTMNGDECDDKCYAVFVWIWLDGSSSTITYRNYKTKWDERESFSKEIIRISNIFQITLQHSFWKFESRTENKFNTIQINETLFTMVKDAINTSNVDSDTSALTEDTGEQKRPAQESVDNVVTKRKCQVKV